MTKFLSKAELLCRRNELSKLVDTFVQCQREAAVDQGGYGRNASMSTSEIWWSASHHWTRARKEQSRRTGTSILSGQQQERLPNTHTIHLHGHCHPNGVHHRGLSQHDAGQQTDVVVLDSSFNPPTLAHKAMLISHVTEVRRKYPNRRFIGVLLYAVRNADKVVSGTDTNEHVHRILMMEAMARDLAESVERTTNGDYGDTNQDETSHDTPKNPIFMALHVGMTHYPLFIDKHRSLCRISFQQESDQMTAMGQPSTRIVWLMGQDTVERFFDLRYYDGEREHLLAAMKAFFKPLPNYHQSNGITTAIRVNPRSASAMNGTKHVLSWLESEHSDLLTLIHSLGGEVSVSNLPASLAPLSSTMARQHLMAKTTNTSLLASDALLSTQVLHVIQCLNIYQ